MPGQKSASPALPTKTALSHEILKWFNFSWLSNLNLGEIGKASLGFRMQNVGKSNCPISFKNNYTKNDALTRGVVIFMSEGAKLQIFWEPFSQKSRSALRVFSELKRGRAQPPWTLGDYVPTYKTCVAYLMILMLCNNSFTGSQKRYTSL